LIADVKGVNPLNLDRRKAHRVDRRLGDANPIRVERAELKKLLGSIRREPAPVRATLLPADERSVSGAVRRPHAALRTFAQAVVRDRLLHDVIRQCAVAREIEPGRRAGARLEAMSPPLRDRRPTRASFRAPPCWSTRNETYDRS